MRPRQFFFPSVQSRWIICKLGWQACSSEAGPKSCLWTQWGSWGRLEPPGLSKSFEDWSRRCDDVDVVLSKCEGVVSPVELDVTKGLLSKDSDLVARKSVHCPPFAFKTGCAEFSENRIQAGSFSFTSPIATALRHGIQHANSDFLGEKSLLVS